MDFKDSHGNLVRGEDSVFPILTKNDEGLFEFLATGFFIGFSGEFITAKHVVLNNKNQPYCPLYIVESNKGKHFVRYVEYIIPHKTSDIVFGKLHNIVLESNGKKVKFESTNIPFSLSIEDLKVNEQISTFAFPNSKIEIESNNEVGSFFGQWFNGDVKEYHPNGRDSVFLPDACYRTSIKILGGSSGGPVINSKCKVVAINSTGFDFKDGEASISYVTPISKLLEIQICVSEIVDTIDNHLKNQRLKLLL